MNIYKRVVYYMGQCQLTLDNDVQQLGVLTVAHNIQLYNYI